MHVLSVKKQDIGTEKQDIGAKKRDIGGLGDKTAGHVKALRSCFGTDVFGRKEVIDRLGLSPAAASALLKKMLERRLIQAVKGQGKGRYRFWGDR